VRYYLGVDWSDQTHAVWVMHASGTKISAARSRTRRKAWASCMRDGRVVEQGPTQRIFEQPEQPYTRALLAAAFELAAPEDGASALDAAPGQGNRALGPQRIFEAGACGH
jgi:Oligopeptide/dipeptide transporter, C-terminal region